MLWLYNLSNAQGKFLKYDNGWSDKGKREGNRERSRESVRGLVIREACTALKYSCWVTFCIKLTHNQRKAFSPMSMGTLGPEGMASLVPNDDELDKRIRSYMSEMAGVHSPFS